MSVGSEGHGKVVNGYGTKTLRSVVELGRRTPVLVGVAGGTAAGKTTFVRRLSKTLAVRQTVSVIDMDSYQKDTSLLPRVERERINFDHPDSFDVLRFHEDLSRLKQGQTIIKPVYDFATHTRYPSSSVLAPGDVVIAEGPMLFVGETVRSLFDLTIFIDTPADIRLRRRLERDIREHGRTLTSAIDHYMKSVLPIHECFIEPTKTLSSLVVHGSEDNETALAELVAMIESSRLQIAGTQPFPESHQHEALQLELAPDQRG